MARDLRIERYYPHRPPRVWSALTDSDAIATWLSASDFVPRVGCEFTLRTTRGPGFDGQVRCKVVTVDPPRTLVFTWEGGPVQTVVAVRLRPEGQGTRLTLVQSGFEGGRGYLASMFLAFWWDGAIRGASIPGASPPGMDPRLAVLGSAGALTALFAVLVVVPILFAPPPQNGADPGAGHEPRSAEKQGRDHRIAKAARANQEITAAEVATADDGNPYQDEPEELGVEPIAGVPASGVEITPLSEGHIYNPAFSFDGAYIAYEVHNDGSATLEYATVSPSPERTKIRIPGTPENPQSQAPSWHPAGTMLFEGSQKGKKSRVYYHKPGSGTAAELLSGREASGRLQWPLVREDGMVMAYVDDGDLRVRHTNSGEIDSLTETAASETSPAFAHDETLLFARVGDGLDIFSVGLGGQAEREIVGGPGDQTRPAMGEHRLVFFEKTALVWNLVSTKIGNRGLVLLEDVRLPHRAGPALSKGWVAAAHDAAEKSGSIALIAVDGSARFDIQIDGTAAGEPALITHGGRTLLAYTALPNKGADWRTLRIVDITDSVSRDG